MRHFACLALAAGVLAACSQQHTSDVQKTLADKRPQIVTAANTALAALEATAQSYNSQHPIPPAIKASLDAADQRAHKNVADLSAAPPADIAAIAQRVAQDMSAMASSLPPGAIPPAAQASIVTFSTLASVLVPIVAADVQANSAAAAPAPVPQPAPPAAAAPPAAPAVPPPAAPAPQASFEPAHAPVHAGAPHH